MNIRLTASVFCLATPISLLSLACSKDDDGDDKNTIDVGTDTGTGVNTGTAVAGEGKGGVTKADDDAWETAADSACNGTSSEPENMPAKIEMVVDVSSSMTQKTGTTRKTKWAQTQSAIIAGFVGDGSGVEDGLPDSVAVGLIFYPNVDTSPAVEPQAVSACLNTEAAIGIATLGADVKGSQRQKLRDALSGIVLGPTGTPTWDALNYGAYTELLEKAGSVSGNPYVVLITDGMPTISAQCTTESPGTFQDVDPEPIVDLITKLNKEKGVKTFLIGSPGSESGRDWMSRAAVAGGTAKDGCKEDGGAQGTNWCHIDLTQSTDFGAALTQALKDIGGSVASCDYTILAEGAEGETIDPLKTVVLAKYADGKVEMINRDDSAENCSEGWYIDSDTNRVVFCKDTCNRVQADAGVQLQVLFGCSETEVVPLL